MTQLVGVTARAGLQTGLVALAAGAFSTQLRSPASDSFDAGASDDLIPVNGSESGNATASSDSAESQPDGASQEDWPFVNRTEIGNETRFDNVTTLGPGTLVGSVPAIDLASGAGAGLSGAMLGGAGALAGLAARVNESLIPHNASLPPPLSMPGDATAQQALLSFDGADPGYLAAVAIASVAVAAAVWLCRGRVFELGRGAITALSGRQVLPHLISGGRLGPALTATLGLTAAAAPLLVALNRDSAKAHGPEARALLMTWLLINSAGRTCQNLLRDTSTQLTREFVPSVRYLTRLGQDASVREPALQPARPGTEAFQALHLDSRVAALRVLLTLTSYCAGIYTCLRFVQPAISRQFGTQGVDLQDQVTHSHAMAQVFSAYFPAYLTSALIECLDSITASLSASIAAGLAGASVELVEGRRPDSRLQEIQDHTAVRIFNAIFTVDLERASNLMRGVDRNSGLGLALQSFALTLTDLRGFTVQFGQHQRALSLAREQAPPPAREPVQIEVLSLNVPVPTGDDADDADDADEADSAAPVRIHVRSPSR